jgi:hypothetical protein
LLFQRSGRSSWPLPKYFPRRARLQSLGAPRHRGASVTRGNGRQPSSNRPSQLMTPGRYSEAYCPVGAWAWRQRVRSLARWTRGLFVPRMRRLPTVQWLTRAGELQPPRFRCPHARHQAMPTTGTFSAWVDRRPRLRPIVEAPPLPSSAKDQGFEIDLGNTDLRSRSANGTEAAMLLLLR